MWTSIILALLSLAHSMIYCFLQIWKPFFFFLSLPKAYSLLNFAWIQCCWICNINFSDFSSLPRASTCPPCSRPARAATRTTCSGTPGSTGRGQSLFLLLLFNIFIFMCATHVFCWRSLTFKDNEMNIILYSSRMHVLYIWI